MPSDELRSLPKVLLHDHLDGGLRPATVIELAGETGYRELPATDPEELGDWFHQGGSSSLERYLEAFSHTSGVMQTPAGLARVAYEAIEDLAVDGVVYGEIRFAPSLHTRLGLSRSEVIAAVLDGMVRGRADFGVRWGIIVDALRQDTDSIEVAEAAVGFAGRGVVGFDLAGPEAGFPASDHAEACAVALAGGLGLTIHAGEGAGVASIADALGTGATRLGHGARIVEDTDGATGGEIESLGPVADRVRAGDVVLELCPTSNLDTGMYSNPDAHPLGRLYRAGFAVTLNTDNRLMSRTSLSREFALARRHHGMGVAEFAVITRTAAAAAFCDDATRAAVLDAVAAGYPAGS